MTTTQGIVAIIAIVVLSLIYLAALIASDRLHARERDRWADERRYLVDRAIARHAGEVLALDRQSKPKPPREDTQDLFIEGLS